MFLYVFFQQIAGNSILNNVSTEGLAIGQGIQKSAHFSADLQAQCCKSDSCWS